MRPQSCFNLLVTVDRSLKEHDRVLHLEEVGGNGSDLGPQSTKTCIAL